MKGYPLNKENIQFFMDIEAIERAGNIVPEAWFQHLRIREREEGKPRRKSAGQPHLAAIIILSDIVYWYRPIIKPGQEPRKRFEADILQLKQTYLEKKFGIPYEQVREAIKYLEDEGVVYKDLRERVKREYAKDLGNVLYIGLNIERLREISIPLSVSGRVIQRLLLLKLLIQILHRLRHPHHF